MKKIIFSYMLAVCANIYANEAYEPSNIEVAEESQKNQLNSELNALKQNLSLENSDKSHPNSSSQTSTGSISQLPESTEYNEIAQQLAGIKISEQFANSKDHQEYSAFITKGWETLSKESISKITPWSQEHVLPKFKNVDTIFYPFGGPDAVYVTNFFPDANTYILVGLEPIGLYSSLKTNMSKQAYVKYLKQSFSSFLLKGYFITSEMQTQLHRDYCKGTMQVILLELAMLGYFIQSLEELSIDKSGSLTSRATKDSVDCIKITFLKNNNGTFVKKTLYYVRLDCSNNCHRLPYLFKFAEQYNFGTFLKSASYILHDNSFSKLKNFILQKTNAVLQDDTGVRFSDYDNSWNKIVFGSYTEPTLPIFRGYKQHELINFYNNNKVEPIPFKIGYGYSQNRPNLMLSTRIKD